MKVKKVTKQRPILKVKKESKTGESSLNRAVKDVKQILKKKNVQADMIKDAKKTVKTDNASKDVKQSLKKKKVKAHVETEAERDARLDKIMEEVERIVQEKNDKINMKKDVKKAVKTENIVKDEKQILEKKNVKANVKKDAKKAVKTDNAVEDVKQILKKKKVKAHVESEAERDARLDRIMEEVERIVEEKNDKINMKKDVKKAVKTDNAVEDVEQTLEKKNVKADVKKAIKNENVIKIKGIKKKVKKLNSKKQGKPTSTERGVIYIGHIPHGFYEEQMKGYFSQFGRVTRVRVARSENTGNSKGFGFVEFELPEVAKIAAESMNNYLMCGRLVKAEYIPPEKQHKKYFKGINWSKGNFPKLKRLEKTTKKVNRSVPNKNHGMIVKNSVKRLSKLSEKLKEQGINIPMKLGRLKV